MKVRVSETLSTGTGHAGPTDDYEARWRPALAGTKAERFNVCIKQESGQMLGLAHHIAGPAWIMRRDCLHDAFIKIWSHC